MLLELVVNSLLYIFPAYSANAVPVVFGGGPPLDFGRVLKDGQPVFGSHKTIRGFFAGLAVGTLVGWGESLIFPSYNPALGFLLSLGALLGDLAGAFLKRRMGLTPGAFLPVIDQIDFVLGALVLSLLLTPPSLLMVLVILACTIPIHFLTNLLAYLLKAKSTPW